ncbi:MAG: exodeoxyribonuclease VII small subunit [Clostridia bacterium]|nr:exodeoxyribonuclease VII small subunit [Clostridia bacterium]
MAKTKSFEESIQELENIIAILEKGECPLDEAVELFEKGVKLSKECHKTLENAEQKIKVLTEDKSPEELKEE